MSPSEPRIPLPKSWPIHVRAAILHVIALAQFATAHTRSWAANSVNARIRLQAERDRAVQELALQREETRIKDARMVSIRIGAPTIHLRNDWRSWNSRRPVVGRWSRQPACFTSRHQRLLPGWGVWMRKVRMPWSRCGPP